MLDAGCLCTPHPVERQASRIKLLHNIFHTRLDAFVMGAGTGGCLAGVSLFLRSKECPAKVYLVDPPGSALFNRVRYGVCYSSQMSERDVRKHRYGRNESDNMRHPSWCDLLRFN